MKYKKLKLTAYFKTIINNEVQEVSSISMFKCSF